MALETRVGPAVHKYVKLAWLTITLGAALAPSGNAQCHAFRGPNRDANRMLFLTMGRSRPTAGCARFVDEGSYATAIGAGRDLLYSDFTARLVLCQSGEPTARACNMAPRTH